MVEWCRVYYGIIVPFKTYFMQIYCYFTINNTAWSLTALIKWINSLHLHFRHHDHWFLSESIHFSTMNYFTSHHSEWLCSHLSHLIMHKYWEIKRKANESCHLKAFCLNTVAVSACSMVLICSSEIFCQALSPASFSSCLFWVFCFQFLLNNRNAQRDSNQKTDLASLRLSTFSICQVSWMCVQCVSEYRLSALWSSTQWVWIWFVWTREDVSICFQIHFSDRGNLLNKESASGQPNAQRMTLYQSHLHTFPFPSVS